MHIIITRFNLAIRFNSGKSNIYEEKIWKNRDYLDKRFAIFDSFLFKSLKSQTDQDFKWLVLFHKDTPDYYLNRISNYCIRFNNFIPLFLTDEESLQFVDYVKRYIEEKWGNEIDYITTRIDNDDYVHEKFVEEIKKASLSMSDGVISFTKGLQYHLDTKILVNYECDLNHYISLKRNNLDTIIYDYDHSTINQCCVVYKVRLNIPMWIEIIHDMNAANEKHWRIKDVFLSKNIRYEYDQIELNKIYKCRSVCTLYLIILVVVNRAKGLCHFIFNNI